jgi:hypothetical protein
MKKLLLAACLSTLSIFSAFAEDGHGHEKVTPGPKGGRVEEVEGGHLEFFVQPDKKVSVTFYSEDMKPQAPAEQDVKLTAEAPSGKAKLEFEKSGDAFVSTTTLPEGDGYRVVLQVKATPDAKSQNIRIEYHAEVCETCKRAEYACVCSEKDKEKGHDH